MFRVKNQRGVASIVLVSGMIVLLALVSIGFTQIMTRESSKSANSAQGQAAYYAAESGLNDAIGYIKANPLASSTNCSTLISGSGALANRANISGDGGTAYSCLLIDPTPADLQYQNIPAYKSQIVRLSVNTPIDKLLISWKPTDSAKSNLVASGQALLTDTAWGSANYAPVMKVSLYPVPSTGSLASTASDSRTYYFYPNKLGAGTVATVGYSALVNNSINALNCEAKTAPAGFSGISYLCNIALSGLLTVNGMNNANAYFYLKLTPIYGAADVQLRAIDSGNNTVLFKNVQSVVDVTAKSGNSTKRLQARVETDTATVDLSGIDDTFPEYALRSANTLCKRWDVPSSGLVKYEANTNKTVCESGGTVIATAPPSLSFSASSNSISSGSSTTLLWTPNNSSSCVASGSWSGAKAASPSQQYSQSTGPLSIGTYIYTLTCSGSGGANPVTRNVSVVVTAPPTTVNIDAYTRGDTGCTSNGGWTCFFWNISISGSYTSISCSNNILSPGSNYNIGFAGNNQDGNPGGQTNWQVQCTTYYNGVENGFGIINTPVNPYTPPTNPPGPPPVDPCAEWGDCGYWW